VVSRFLKLSLPAILAVGLACGVAPAHAQQAADTPFNAYFTRHLSSDDASDTHVRELARGWGGGWFFGDSTAVFRDLLDISEDPGKVTDGDWIIFQAGGNAILGTYHGRRSEPNEDGVASLSGSYTISDGWGLFAGDFGHGVFTGTVDVVTGNWTIYLEGMLSPTE